jgi:hypothetical protein
MKIEININVSDKLVAFIKRIFTVRNGVFATAAILFGIGALLFADQITKPHTFKGGDVISASQVNANFDALYSKVNQHDSVITGLSAGYGIAPIGSIVAWHKNLPGTPQTHEGWVECNGQTLVDTSSPLNGQVIPDLNSKVYTDGRGRYLRGGTTSGQFNNSTRYADNGSKYNGLGGSYYGACYHYIYDAEGPSPDGADYSETSSMNFRFQVTAMTVVWIMRVK